MCPQLSYDIDMPYAQKGLLVDIGFTDIVTGIADVVAGIAPGSGVVAGAIDPDRVVLPTSSAQLFTGVVLNTQTKEQNLSGVVLNAQNTPVNLLRRGRVWVEVNVEVFNGQDAYLDVGAGGVFTNLSSGNIPTGGKFRRDSDTELNLSILDINLPMADVSTD